MTSEASQVTESVRSNTANAVIPAPFVSIVRDITELKKMEYAVESSLAVLCIGKPLPDQSDFNTTYLSKNIIDLTGFEADEVTGFTGAAFWKTRIPPNHLQKYLAEVPLLWRNGHHTFEYQFLHKDGAYRWIREKERVIRNAKGEVQDVIGYWTDVTESKMIEEKYHALFTACPISLWEEDYSAVKQFLDELRQKGVSDFNAYFATHPNDIAKCAGLVKVVNVNQATLDLYGANSVDDIVGGLSGILTEESNRQFVDEIVALDQGKKHYETEIENKTLRGELKPCNLICSVVPGYEESLGRVLVCLVDLTSQKRMEEENKRLTAEATQRLLEVIDHAESLARVKEKLKTIPDVSSGLQVILEAALWEFGLDFGAILVLDRQTNTMKVRASKGKEREIRLEDSYPLEGFPDLKDLQQSEPITRIVGERDRSVFNAAIEYIIPILPRKGLFGVMMFGKMTRDSGEVIDMHLLTLYADLVYSFVLERSVAITPVLETNTLRTVDRTLDTGQIYVVRNDAPKAFEVFAGLVFSGHEGLCITRTHPRKIRSRYKLEKTPIVWLTSEASRGDPCVGSLQELSIMIGDFLDKAKEPVILFEGFEYLVLNNGFTHFLKFLQIIKDRIQTRDGILIAPFSDQTLEPRELAILKVETTIFTEEARETGDGNLEHDHHATND